MNRIKLLHSVFILSLGSIMASCGGNSSISKSQFSSTTKVSEEKLVVNEERNIATRICYAYQSKSKNFRSLEYNDFIFTFTGNQTSCLNENRNYEVKSSLQKDSNFELFYSTPTDFDKFNKFNKKIQTDTSGYLSQICTKIVKNEEFSNTINQDNIKIQISFFHEDIDGFMIQYFTKQTDDTFLPTSSEKFKVRTQINFSPGKIIGMDEYYSTQNICTAKDSKNKVSEFIQAFVYH